LLIIGPLHTFLNPDGKNSDEFSTLDKSTFPGNKSNKTLGKEMISEEQSCLDHDHVIGEKYPDFHDQASIDDQSPSDDYRSPILAGSNPKNNLFTSEQPKTNDVVPGSITTGSHKLSFIAKTFPEGRNLVKKSNDDERKDAIPELIVTRVNPVIPLPLSTSANTPPEASNLTITPVNPRTSDDLTANYDYHDADGDNETGSTIRWYKNGELQENLNDMVTVGAGNTTKGEFWKFTVQVFDGEAWSIIYTSQTVSILNSAPTISNFDFSPVDPKTDDDLSISYDFNDDDNGDLEFGTIIRWYRNNVLQSTYNDSVTVDKALIVKGDIWNVSIKVSDGNNYSTWLNNSITILNTAPTVVDFTTMIYIPEGGLTNTSTLVANWEEQDADGDTITDQFIRWYYYDNETDITPSLVSSLSNCTVVQPGNTTKHQKWYFEILLFDGEDWSSSWKSAMLITIGNSEPRVDNIVLTGGTTTTDDIVLTYSFYDADGDIESTEIEWTIIHTGNPIFETVTVTGNATNPIKGTATLSSSFITAGDLIWVVITPDDNDGAIDINGQVVSVNLPGSNVRVIVGNTPPVITGPPTILADHPNGTTIYSSIYSIYVNYTALVVDIDAGESDAVYDVNEELNDNICYATVSRIIGAGYRWYKYDDSSGEWELQEGLTSSFIDPYYLHRDDQWMASVRPRDIYGYYGAWVNSTPATIGNSLPLITDITWNTENPQTGEDLEVSYVYDDYDGDPEGLSKIQWFVNNGTHAIEIISNENMTILTRDNYNKSDLIFIIITPHDGDGYGFQFNSTTFTGLITIINTAPEVIASKINDHINTTYTTDDLVLSWSYNDADGDPEVNQSVIIHWFTSGEYHPEHDNLSVIPSTETAKGQNWQARFKVFDNHEYSCEVFSPILYIANSQMVINWVEINNNASTATVGDNFIVNIDTSDPDGDMIFERMIYWYVNGEYRSEFENETFIDAFTFVKGDVIHCVYNVHDGEEWTKSETSQTVTIINSLPEVSNIAFILEHGVNVVTPVNDSREFLIEDEALIIDYHFHDDDDVDSDESLVYWYCNGELQDQYTSNRFIPASVTLPGDVWQVIIIPHDGDEGGYQVVSANISIESRPFIDDHGFEIQPGMDGFYHLWTKANDERNPIDRVIYDITVNELDHLLYREIITRTNRTVDTWVIDDFQLLEAVRYSGLEDNYLFTLVGTNVTVHVTVVSKVAYSAVDYSIKSSLVFTFTIQEDAFTGDDDGDGLTNLQENVFGSRSDITDTDLDGIDDHYEWLMGLNPVFDDSSLDEDHDGLPNLYEYQHGLLANVDDANEDKDGDGLTNIMEFRIGTDPLDEDTDHDSYPDKLELDLGYSPLSDFSNPSIKSVISGLFIIVITLFYYPLILIIKQREIIRIIIAQIHKGMTKIKNGLKKVVTTIIVVLTREIFYQIALKIMNGLLSVVNGYESLKSKLKDKTRATITSFRPLMELENNLEDLFLVISVTIILMIALHEPLTVLPVTITISCVFLAILCDNLLLEIKQRLKIRKITAKFLFELMELQKKSKKLFSLIDDMKVALREEFVPRYYHELRKIERQHARIQSSVVHSYKSLKSKLKDKTRATITSFRPLMELENNLEDLSLVISVTIILMIALHEPLTVLPVTITISCVLLAVLSGNLVLEIKYMLKIRKITAKFPVELMELQEKSKKLFSSIDDMKVALREEFNPGECRFNLRKIERQHDQIQSSVQSIASKIDASLDASPEYKPRLYQLVNENESLTKHLHDEIIHLRDEMILPLVKYIEQNATSYDDILLLNNLLFLVKLKPSREQLQSLKPLLISILFSTSGNELLRAVKKLLGFTHESPAEKEKTKPLQLVLVK
jgi:hypothetical protein